MRFRIAAFLCFLLLPTAALAQANRGPVVPIPCPDQTWVFDDPSFESLADAHAHFGRYDGGLYRIEVPTNWNGELILWAHGTRANTGPDGSLLRAPTLGDGPPGSARDGSRGFREHLVRRGFAWAASSFRCNGNVRGVGLIDTVGLIDVFRKVSGREAPTRVYLAGVSQGGLNTWQGLQYCPGRFAGGLAMCPPVSTDFFNAVGAAAEFIAGRSFSRSDPTAVAEIDRIFGTPGRYTQKGQQLASVQIDSSGGPRPFAGEGLASRFAANILGNPSDLLMQAGTNVTVDYSIDEGLGLTRTELNAGVRRRVADDDLRGPDSRYTDTRAFDGRIEQPLLTLHGTGDLQAHIGGARDLRAAVVAQGREGLLVQRIMRIPGHCGFSDAEQIRAFDDLVRWAREGVRPDGDDFWQDLRDAGRRFTDPLRPGDPGTVNLGVGQK